MEQSRTPPRLLWGRSPSSRLSSSCRRPWHGPYSNEVTMMLSNATAAFKKQRARVDLFAWLAPSMADVIFVCILVVFLAHGTTILSADGDAARHLGVGTYILDHRSVPHVDMFSHTK